MTGNSWAELLASTLERVAKHFEQSAEQGLRDPVLGTPMKPALESWE